jgi:hypothetical protein
VGACRGSSYCRVGRIKILEEDSKRFSDRMHFIKVAVIAARLGVKLEVTLSAGIWA